jgi:hypothetical protein
MTMLVEVMMRVANAVNEDKRRMEMLESIDNWQSQVEGWTVSLVWIPPEAIYTCRCQNLSEGNLMTQPDDVGSQAARYIATLTSSRTDAQTQSSWAQNSASRPTLVLFVRQRTDLRKRSSRYLFAYFACRGLL